MPEEKYIKAAVVRTPSGKLTIRKPHSRRIAQPSNPSILTPEVKSDIASLVSLRRMSASMSEEIEDLQEIEQWDEIQTSHAAQAVILMTENCQADLETELFAAKVAARDGYEIVQFLFQKVDDTPNKDLVLHDQFQCMINAGIGADDMLDLSEAVTTEGPYKRSLLDLYTTLSREGQGHMVLNCVEEGLSPDSVKIFARRLTTSFPKQELIFEDATDNIILHRTEDFVSKEVFEDITGIKPSELKVIVKGVHDSNLDDAATQRMLELISNDQDAITTISNTIGSSITPRQMANILFDVRINELMVKSDG